VHDVTITGLLHRNGAGKTTLMQLLAVHRVPTRSPIQMFGADPYENAAVLRESASSRRGSATPTTSGCRTL
jgi:ABC-2 type transport system ATP-binding protein